jgi:hypothetical protein
MALLVRVFVTSNLAVLERPVALCYRLSGRLFGFDVYFSILVTVNVSIGDVLAM